MKEASSKKAAGFTPINSQTDVGGAHQQISHTVVTVPIRNQAWKTKPGEQIPILTIPGLPTIASFMYQIPRIIKLTAMLNLPNENISGQKWYTQS